MNGGYQQKRRQVNREIPLPGLADKRKPAREPNMTGVSGAHANHVRMPQLKMRHAEWPIPSASHLKIDRARHRSTRASPKRHDDEPLLQGKLRITHLNDRYRVSRSHALIQPIPCSDIPCKSQLSGPRRGQSIDRLRAARDRFPKLNHRRLRSSRSRQSATRA
jgi:hypothetical protein